MHGIKSSDCLHENGREMKTVVNEINKFLSQTKIECHRRLNDSLIAIALAHKTKQINKKRFNILIVFF